MGEATTAKNQINLLRGWPHPSLLPTRQIQEAANAALSDPTVSIPGLLYGPDPGYQPLRETISKWLWSFYNPASSSIPKPKPAVSERGNADAERICITGGASQNLACVLQVYSDPVYTHVWMVAPCYFLACRIFEDTGMRTHAVGEGTGGLDLEALERGLRSYEEVEEERPMKLKQPKPWSKIYRHIIYCVPTFSNPSGKSMSLATRILLVQLARKYNALIISDDVYDFLQWPISTSSSSSSSDLTRALLPRLVDVDRILGPVPGPESFGNAMSNGSFSKIAGPGVRTGWAESTPKFAYGLSQCGSSRSGGAPSQLTATVMHQLLLSGALEAHIEMVLKPAYKRRCELMLAAIARHLLPLGVRLGDISTDGKDVFGGYFIWINLPSGVDAEVVAARAKEEENLIVAPGKLFEVQADDSVRFPQGMRLCFSWEEEKDLCEGVDRLRRVLKGVMDAKGANAHVARSVIGDKQDLGKYQ